MQLFMALLPIVTLVALILVFRRSVLLTAAMTLLAVLVSARYWGMGADVVGAAGVRGVLIAVEIIIILFSALLIFEILERHRISAIVRQKVEWVSKDYRIQTILLSAGVIYFMEGVAGFGTPAIIAVPLFIAIGFKPLAAVIMTLVSDSIPVSFGAVGLPMTFGLATPLQLIADSPDQLLADTIFLVAAINILGMFVLLNLVTILVVRMHNGRMTQFRELLPFIFWVSATVGLSSLLVAHFVGAELASILGGAVGMVVVTVLARNRIFTPKTERRIVMKSDEQPSEGLHQGLHSRLLFKAFLPYGLLIALLVITRVPFFKIGGVLQEIDWSLQNIFGSGVSYTFAPLYSVSTILLLSGGFALLLFHESIEQSFGLVKKVVKVLGRVLAILAMILVFVQIFTLSGFSQTGVAMPIIIARELSAVTGVFWPVFAPFIGALGAFVAGSATVSNLVFGSIQYDIALEAGVAPARVLALQSVGAAVGNMVALHNIVAALTIAKLSEAHAQEVLKRNALPLFILLGLLAGIGMLYSVVS